MQLNTRSNGRNTGSQFVKESDENIAVITTQPDAEELQAAAQAQPDAEELAASLAQSDADDENAAYNTRPDAETESNADINTDKTRPDAGMHTDNTLTHVEDSCTAYSGKADVDSDQRVDNLEEKADLTVEPYNQSELSNRPSVSDSETSDTVVAKPSRRPSNPNGKSKKREQKNKHSEEKKQFANKWMRRNNKVYCGKQKINKVVCRSTRQKVNNNFTTEFKECVKFDRTREGKGGSSQRSQSWKRRKTKYTYRPLIRVQLPVVVCDMSNF